MADELPQEAETDDLVKYYNQLCNHQVALECECLWWQAAIAFQIHSTIPPLIKKNIDPSEWTHIWSRFLAN